MKCHTCMQEQILIQLCIKQMPTHYLMLDVIYIQEYGNCALSKLSSQLTVAYPYNSSGMLEITSKGSIET